MSSISVREAAISVRPVSGGRRSFAVYQRALSDGERVVQHVLLRDDDWLDVLFEPPPGSWRAGFRR